jgi:hydrogenase expression/formation protein HypC
MCLAIPGKLLSIQENEDILFRSGEISFDGVTREVNLTAVPEAQVGDFVLIHAGMAIALVDEEEAKKTLELFRDLEDDLSQKLQNGLT